jgi:hypothetical protein
MIPPQRRYVSIVLLSTFFFGIIYFLRLLKTVPGGVTLGFGVVAGNDLLRILSVFGGVILSGCVLFTDPSKLLLRFLEKLA